MEITPNNRELSFIFNTTEEQVVAWIKQGMDKSSLLSAVMWYFRQKPPEKPELLRLKEQLVQVSVYRKVGKLLPKDIVLDTFEKMLCLIKEEVLCLPGTLAPKLEGSVEARYIILENTIKMMLNILNAKVNPLMVELENYTPKEANQNIRLGV